MKEKKTYFKKNLFKGVKILKSDTKNSGITLIALVITIIILLILAGITISSLTNSGLFDKVKEAKGKWKNAQNEEEMQLAKYNNEIDSYVGGNRDVLGIMTQLNKVNITSTSWVKMELNESIDNYKLLEFVNGDFENDCMNSYGGTLILSTNLFKNNCNAENKYVRIYFENASGADRSVYFYYKNSENAIYAKTAHSAYYPLVLGIK